MAVTTWLFATGNYGNKKKYLHVDPSVIHLYCWTQHRSNCCQQYYRSSCCFHLLLVKILYEFYSYSLEKKGKFSLALSHWQCSLSNWITFGNSHVVDVTNKYRKEWNLEIENPCANVSKRSFPPTICTRDDAHYLIDCQNRGPLGLVVDQKRTIQKKNYTSQGRPMKERSEMKRGKKRENGNTSGSVHS